MKELKALDSAYWYSSVCEGTCNSQPAEDYDFRGVATGDVPPPAGFSANDFKIATLKEVLKAFPDVLMSIEIKGVAPDSIPTAEALADLLRQYGRSTNVMIASFNDATTAAFKAYAPEINTTPGLSEVVSFVSAPGPLPDHVAFQVPRTFSGTSVPPLIIDPAHANNLSVYFFIDPSEEKLKSEFAGVNRLMLPMHAVIRIDEVEKRGQNKILDIETTSNVTPFPLYGPGRPGKD